MATPRQLQKMYEQGCNISAFLRSEKGVEHNTSEIIEVSYDLQTGSYIDAMANSETAKHIEEYSQQIASRILSLCTPQSILEAGAGEGTTLSGVAANLGRNIRCHAFDLSWSRIAYARKWLRSKGCRDTVLCSGDLLNVPFLDDSIDVVYTSHAIEPNGSNETPILRELYRVAKRYVVLLEPAYDFADAQARRRMDHHGYCKFLPEICHALGYDVVEHELFPYAAANPLNPTAITIVRKSLKDGTGASHAQNDSDRFGKAHPSSFSNSHTHCGEHGSPAPADDVFACPKFKTPVKRVGEMLLSPEALVVYPIVGGIPCLRIENGIVASKYEELMGAAG